MRSCIEYKESIKKESSPMERKNETLILDGNAFYEIDPQCMKQKEEQRKKKQKPKPGHVQNGKRN